MSKKQKPGVAIDVVSKMGKTSAVLRHIWPLMGMDYDAEKRKQEELWAALSERQPKPERKRTLEFYQKLDGLDTQAKRAEAIKNLEALAEVAHQFAIKKENPRLAAKWARIEAYIWQTCNSLMKSYDKTRIEKEIEKLKRLVEDELGKRT